MQGVRVWKFMQSHTKKETLSVAKFGVSKIAVLYETLQKSTQFPNRKSGFVGASSLILKYVRCFVKFMFYHKIFTVKHRLNNDYNSSTVWTLHVPLKIRLFTGFLHIRQNQLNICEHTERHFIGYTLYHVVKHWKIQLKMHVWRMITQQKLKCWIYRKFQCKTRQSPKLSIYLML